MLGLGLVLSQRAMANNFVKHEEFDSHLGNMIDRPDTETFHPQMSRWLAMSVNQKAKEKRCLWRYV